MKLYYCQVCAAVFAFNLFDIQKHDLEKPHEKTCRVCKSRSTLEPLENLI